MGKPFVFDIALAWWDRFRGKLEPRPCPFSGKGILELRVRTLLASPRRVVGAFGLAAGARVLEIGPGTGYYSVEAARRVGHTGQLICVELQREMALAVRHRLTAAGHASAYVLQGDARGVPLRNGSVDHVFLVAVLGEIPNRREALAEIHRVLRPGGRLSVSEQLPDPDFVTPRALRRELRAAGFVEQITRGHLWYTSTWMTVG